MFFYFCLLLFSSIFSFCYAKAKDISAQVVFLVLCYLTLFLPAALRYGIGADYFSYVTIFSRVANGVKIKQEVAIVIVSKLLQKLGLDYHWLFVFYSFFSILFVFLAIPRKYFFVGIPVYVVWFYMDSYCLLRQAMACSIMLYVFRLYIENKNKKAFFWSIVAFLNHKVVVIPILLILCFKLIPKMKKSYQIILFSAFTVFVYLFKGKIVNIVLTKLVPFTPYARYLTNRYAGVGASVSSGLGLLLRLLCLILLVYLLDSEVISKKEYQMSLGLALYLSLVTSFSAVLYILIRLVNSITFGYCVVVVNSYKSKNKYKKIIFLFLIAAYLFIFMKSLTPISNKGAVGGKQICPYVNIFNYKDNEIIYNRSKNALNVIGIE